MTSPTRWLGSAAMFAVVIVFVFVFVVGRAHESNVEREAATAGVVDHSGDVSSEFVTAVHGDDIDAFVSSSEMVAVHFCWERGANCLVALPIVEQVAGEFRSVKFGRMCTVENRDKVREFDLAHTPTLIFFYEGEEVARMWDVYGDKVEDYTVFSLRAFFKRVTAPPVIVLNDDAELSRFSRLSELVSVAFVRGDDDDDGALWRSVHHAHNHTASQVYAHVASLMRNDMLFGVVRLSSFVGDSTAALHAAQVTLADAPHVVLYTNHYMHEHEPIAMTGPRDEVASVRGFLERHAHAPFGQINHTNYLHFEAMGLPLAIVFVDEADTVMNDALRAMYEPLARELRGKVSFGFMCGKTYSALARTLGVESKKRPQLVIEEVHSHRHWAAPSSLRLTDKKKVRAFIDSVLADNLAPTVRSAPEPNPARPVGSHVTELVGTTLASFVTAHNAKADVIVLFYMPFYSHSKNTMEPYQKVATRFASEPRLVFAQMDFVKNDVPILNGAKLVRHMPTLALFPAGNMSAVTLLEKDDDSHVPTVVRDWLVSASSFGLRARDFAFDDETFPPEPEPELAVAPDAKSEL